MICNEKDAAKKRCTPTAVVWLLDADRRNSLQAGGAEVTDKCIGSKCMQWLWWDYTKDGFSTHILNGDGPGAQFQRGTVVGGPGKRATAPRGYCGLTGARE